MPYLKPQFIELTKFNNTTGYHDIYYEVVLVVPWNTDILKVSDPIITFKIIDAPGVAKVAGYLYKNIRVPDYDRYSKTFYLSDLAPYAIDVASYTISNGKFTYRSNYSGLETDLTYDSNVKYYDLSSITLEVEGLPDGLYYVEWSLEYPTITSDIDINGNPYLICISNDKISKTTTRELYEHPGIILDAMMYNTPEVYYTTKLSDFYRPLAEVLNDLRKQLDLLSTINFVDLMPKQYIQYLAYLVGWDLMPMHNSDDKLKRALIKNAWKLKQYKGSYKAIEELLNIFGYAIYLTKLHYDEDGTSYLPVNENDSIKRELLYQNESSKGFISIDVPLLDQPTRYITIIAYKLADNYTYNLPTTKYLSPSEYTQIDHVIQDDYTIPNYEAKQTLTIDLSNNKIISDTYINYKLVNFVKYDKFKNVIYINADRYYDEYNILWYINYETKYEILPNEYYRSNKFDLKITSKNNTPVDTNVLNYLIQYIIDLKPFHSILRKLIVDLTTADAYLVNDLCVGDYINEPNTDMGELQVPPAIIPDSSACGNLNRNFKTNDLRYRAELLELLKIEREVLNHEVDTHPIDTSLQPYSNIQFVTGTKNLTSCFRGRVSEEINVDQSVPIKDAWYNTHCEHNYGGGSYDTNWIKNPINKAITIETIHTFGYSKHRFATYGKLQNDYTSTYKWRPWDNLDHCVEEPITKTISYISVPSDWDIEAPTVVEVLTRVEEISFEDKYFTSEANGLIPDITNFSSHPTTDVFYIPYTTTPLRDYDKEENGEYKSHYSSIGCISPSIVLFHSYNQFESESGCIDDNPSSSIGADYIDGYKYEGGVFSFQTTFNQLEISGDINGLPWPGTGDEPVNLYFKFKTEMYDDNEPIGLRYSCGNYIYGMTPTTNDPELDEELTESFTIMGEEELGCTLLYDGKEWYGHINVIDNATQNVFGNYELFDKIVDASGNITTVAMETDLSKYDATITLYNKQYINNGYRDGYHVYRVGYKQVDRWNYQDNGTKIIQADRYLTLANGGAIDLIGHSINTFYEIKDITLQSSGHESEYLIYIEDETYRNTIVNYKFNNFISDEVTIT